MREQPRYVRRLAPPFAAWCRKDEVAARAFPMWPEYTPACEALMVRDPSHTEIKAAKIGDEQ